MMVTIGFWLCFVVVLLLLSFDQDSVNDDKDGNNIYLAKV